MMLPSVPAIAEDTIPDIPVPTALPHREIHFDLVPDAARQTLYIRMWREGQLAGTLHFPRTTSEFACEAYMSSPFDFP